MSNNSKLKFSIRFSDEKRGRVIKGQTVNDYLRELGATLISITPAGGSCRINGEEVLFSLNIR